MVTVNLFLWVRRTFKKQRNQVVIVSLFLWVRRTSKNNFFNSCSLYNFFCGNTDNICGGMVYGSVHVSGSKDIETGLE